MASLFEINKEIDELTEQLIDPETGEVDEEVLTKLEALGIDQDKKLEAYGMKIKNLEAEVDALMKHSSQFKHRADVKVAQIDRLMDMVTRTLGGEKKEYENVVFSFRTSKKVEIVDEDLVPDEFCTFKTSKKPSKSEIKKVIDSGKEVPGCTLVISKNLQVK